MNQPTESIEHDEKAKRQLEALGAFDSSPKDESSQLEQAVWPSLAGVVKEFPPFPQIKLRHPTLQTLILFKQQEIELTSGVSVSECADPVADAVKVITMLRIDDRSLTKMLAEDWQRFDQLLIETAIEIPTSISPTDIVSGVIDFLNACSSNRVEAEIPEALKSKEPGKPRQRHRGR